MNVQQSTTICTTTCRPRNQHSNIAVNQTDQYYFMPIREQASTAISTGNLVTDSVSILLSADIEHPSALDLFHESSPNYFSSSASTMNPSDTPTVNKSNNNYNLSDSDLAALMVSSVVTTTPSTPLIQVPSNMSMDDINHNNNETPNNALDEVFLNHLTDLACSSASIIDQPTTIGPPPGFENFLFDPSSTTDLLLSHTTNKNSTSASISNGAIQPPVSSSDTINFSQLLQSTSVDIQQQQQQPSLVNNIGNIRSSTSSHSSFTSDEQSIFFPMSTRPYSSSSSSSSTLHATSQIHSTNNPSSIMPTTNIAAKPHIPNSLSLNINNNNNNNNNHFSSPSSSLMTSSSTTDSPTPITTIENDKRINDGNITPSHIFSTTNSFFTNGHTDFAPSKPKISSINQQSSVTARTSSSSASSSTSSSIDEALIQLTQQQQQQIQNASKLFNDDFMSIFHLPSKINLDQQQQAVHDNISFLASMATASTPVTSESTWQPQTTSTSLESNVNLQRKMRAMMLQQQTSIPQPLQRNNSNTMHELMQTLNELCYKGFDELNALIQEQRWVQNCININSPSSTSSMNLNGSNTCSSRILIVPEYFIFKCKKTELTASHVFELLSTGRAELRLRDLMFVFKSWKESILNAEIIHHEEENKLRLSTEHPQSYYMTDTVLQSAFDRISYSIRQLCNLTQQARAAFQYATINIFQTLSRQQHVQSQTSSSTNPLVHAQLQAMQQQISAVLHRPTGSIHTTP